MLLVDLLASKPQSLAYCSTAVFTLPLAIFANSVLVSSSERGLQNEILEELVIESCRRSKLRLQRQGCSRVRYIEQLFDKPFTLLLTNQNEEFFQELTGIKFGGTSLTNNLMRRNAGNSASLASAGSLL